jgi:hypothetical protein
MARRVLWALLPLVACLSSGCLPLETVPETAAPVVRMRPELHPDAVVMDIAVIERPLGDPFLNQELWQRADQLAVDLDRKSLLEANGLRVGQLVGLTPAELQDLLTSPRWCPQPYKRFTPSGRRHTCRIEVLHPHCQYDVHLGRKVLDEQVDRANFCFDVTPTHTNDGRTKLSFIPKVETGEQMLPFQPASHEGNWVYRVERPAKDYPELSFEVTLRPNEYLIIGPDLTRKNTIGHRAFVEDEGLEPMQRLLVIRTARSLHSADEPSLAELARSSASPPLAVQATMGVIRASRP